MRTLKDYEALENIIYTGEQINQIRKGYEYGLSDEEIATYANPIYPALIMMEKIDKLVKKHE